LLSHKSPVCQLSIDCCRRSDTVPTVTDNELRVRVHMRSKRELLNFHKVHDKALCVYVCVCVCACARILVYRPVYSLCIYVYTYMYVSMYTHTHTHWSLKEEVLDRSLWRTLDLLQDRARS